ncbi:MAG TPA: hypothetical protein HPP41_00090 [Deltaproteobacteria bacterium]|nr:hypothetical protein [Deltaproteobacteria bacterium]
MAEYSNASAHLRDKRLQNLLDKVTSHLYATKEKQLFEAEIRKTIREIEYIKDKITVARKQLQKTVAANKEFEPRLQEAARKLSRLQKDRETAETEYAKLKAIEEDMEGKRATLPGIRNKIVHLREDVRKSSLRFEELQLRHREALAEKEHLVKETGALKTKLSRSENEIPLMRNTRDIFAGVMPEGFDADTYHAIQDQGDLEKTIANYVDKVNEQIETLKKEASELSTQIDEKRSLQRSLVSKKEHLQKKIEDLTADVGGEVNKSKIVNELNRLQEEKKRFTRESNRMMKELNRLDVKIKSLDDELEQGEKLERDLMKKYTYLASRKQEMDEFDNIDAEIERLQNEIQNHNTDSNINDKLIEITNDIKQDVGLMNRKLQFAIEEYNKQFSGFDKTVSRLLF